jgi:hypothetical protein
MSFLYISVYCYIVYTIDQTLKVAYSFQHAEQDDGT